MRRGLVVVALCLFLSMGAVAQPIDRSNAPDCSMLDIAVLAETAARYQGIRGINPSAPSTYNLIGNHKFSGTILSVSNTAFGENWYPIRTEKQTLTGTFHNFGVSNFGDESDWNIHILPDASFADFVADAIPYRSTNPVISTFISEDWATTSDGRILIEAEITPDEHRYGNPWFNNREQLSPLLNKRLTAYGPFVREEAHGNQPEIHPAEQFWWRDGDAMVILLVVDDSNRFNDAGDYTTRRVTTPAFIPWTQEKAQRAELSLAFELDPARTGLYMSVQSLDDLNFLRDASFPDAAAGNPIINSFRGNTILAVDQSAAINPFVGVTFRDICVNRTKGTLQGYVVLNTAIGNGSSREGFVALRVDRRDVGFDAGPAILTGDLLNTWKVLTPYDNRVSPADILSSDMRGMGIVDGLIDFNGNGKTDLFAKVGDAWMVLFDGRGTWQELNTSSIPLSDLRFGDIDGDGKTDVLRVGDHNKVVVSFGGTGGWTELTDAGEQNPMIKVGDFNGDGRTDIVYFKMKAPSFPPPQPLTFRADMFVKFSARGEWKKLNNDYVIRDFDEYLTTFRFGDFNGDGITDIFRFRNGSFNVYFSGTGDIQPLHRPSFAIDVNDFLFVPNLTIIGLTDVIHVDRNSKKWTVFPGGKPGTLPLTIRFGDPADVRFGDLDADPAVEPFAIDFVSQRRSPADVAMTPVTKAISEPVAYTRYVPGSVKRVREGDRSFLTVSLNVQRSSGNRPVNRKGEDLRSVSRVSAGKKNLLFKRAAQAKPGQLEVLGTIENVPLDRAEENLLQIAFAPSMPPSSFKLPAHGITAVANAVVLQPGSGDVSWTRWQALLTSNASSPKSALLASPPAPPARIDSIAFELAPLYSSREGEKVRLAEMDDVAKELNEIAYGSNRERANAIFGDRAPFAITWQFELKNMNTGELLPIEDSASLASQGKWPASNVRFAFPGSADLLRFTATAKIEDDLGNRSIEPIRLVFWNQQIALTAPDAQLAEWFKQLPPGVDEANLLVKARYLAEDGVLSPVDVESILR